MQMIATYSPEDNKLRLSVSSRLDAETYARVKSAGFVWAPKQQIFVAPMWTPNRADLLTELCGEIGDEDTSLVDRAAERAERFGDYSESRAADAEEAHKQVERITDGIPLGQPILVGHHSERHARKDAERIENGMRKAVKMWETSQYWKSRAAGAIRAAKYKELPAVRARRIEGLEADKRRHERAVSESESYLKLWKSDGLTLERAKTFSNYGHVSKCFTLAEYPRDLPKSQYEGSMSLWSALDEGIITAEQARDIAVPHYERVINGAVRWLDHINNRIEYERAMLEESGASKLLDPKPRPKQLPLCNYRSPNGLDIENIYHCGEMIHYPQIELTSAQYAAINRDYKGTRVVGNSHRVRTAMVKSSLACVFLTDSKVHSVPEPIERSARVELREPRPLSQYAAPEPTKFDAMKETLKAGVQVVSAPQLFPTPKELARRMVELAGIQPGETVLEPSAGTGAIVREIIAAVDTEIVGYDINPALVSKLTVTFPSYRLQARCRDFLKVTEGMGQFPVVLMNPPFVDAQDIGHIRHAMKFLRPGGRLVAICANGSRQQAKLKPIMDTWEDLPSGTFKESGTGVNAALVTYTRCPEVAS